MHPVNCSAQRDTQWADASMVTDYVERMVRAWFRSYPPMRNMYAMVYDKEGFYLELMRWTMGKTVRIYGGSLYDQGGQAAGLDADLSLA